MSSPGSGKTTLLEYLAEVADFKFCVVEGDLETNKDADRLKAKNIPAVQIQTGSVVIQMLLWCIKDYITYLQIILMYVVENVGNLVCPEGYDVGTHFKYCQVSVPGGGKD